jgi:GT2 family glycosyltransferase
VIDIVIPVRDNLPWLRMCLTAIHAFTENPYRVLIVDNDSQEQATREWLREAATCRKIPSHGAVDVVRRGLNDSFSASVNTGVFLGSNRYVVVLNSDAIVTKGWDAAFVADLSHQDVGLTGAQTNLATGAQGAGLGAAARHAGPSLSALVAGGRDMPTAPFLIFFAVAFRRETWNKIGPLDEKTCQGWGGGEDLDWSWRVIDAGLRCVISAAYVLHACSATYAAQGIKPEAKAKLEAANIEALVRKHGADRVRRGQKQQVSVMVALFHRMDMALTKFMHCLIGNATDLVAHGIKVSMSESKRTIIHLAREFSVDNALKVSERRWGAGGDELDYLIMVDDDHTFPPSAFRQLVSSGKPIVSALAYRRSVSVMDPTRADHSTCVFRWDDPVKRTAVTSLEGIEHTGLQRVDATGFGMVAIRMDVLKALRAKHPTGKEKLFDFAQFGEDIGFCRLAADAGFETWCDTELVIGHIGDNVVVDEPYVKRWREQVAEAGGLKR